MMRQAVKERKTLETAVSVSIGLDGAGKADIATGVGFFVQYADTAGQAWFS